MAELTLRVLLHLLQSLAQLSQSSARSKSLCSTRLPKVSA